MAAESVDLDRIAKEVADRMRQENLSLRDAGVEIGCSAATLSRILKGRNAESTPDTKNLFRVVSWLGKSISDFEPGRKPQQATLTDVEVHLRALPGLSEVDKDALVAMVRAAHDSFRSRSKKK